MKYFYVFYENEKPVGFLESDNRMYYSNAKLVTREAFIELGGSPTCSEGDLNQPLIPTDHEILMTLLGVTE